MAIRGDALDVADTWNGRVQAYTLDGVLRASVGDLYGPRGIAIAPDGRVWVTDTGNHRVVSFGPLLSAKPIIGKKGSRPAGSRVPRNRRVSPGGEIYVADAGNTPHPGPGPDGPPAVCPLPGLGRNWNEGLTIEVDKNDLRDRPALPTSPDLDRTAG